MAAFLPFFNVGMSIAGLWLMGVWLVDLILDAVDGDPGKKFRRLAQSKVALALIALFVLHLIGLAWTEDFGYAFKDIRVKLPLFFLPLVLGSLPQVSRLWLQRFLDIFVLAVVVSTFTSMWVYWGWVDREYGDVREITHAFIARISHIRLSLLVALALALSAFSVWRRRKAWPLFVVAACWLLYFLWTIESVTGMGLTMVLLGFFMLRLVWTQASKLVRQLALAGLLVIWAGSLVYVASVVRDYFDVEALQPEDLDTFSPNGERYFHDLSNSQIENGQYVWVHIAHAELKSTWSARSEVDFDGSDARGQELKATLIRYLTSKGLRKDAGGVQALNEEDIRCVEQGVASIAELKAGGLRARIRKILLEYDIYRNGGNPGGNSVTQRVEFWKAAGTIVAENPLVGVGTGDVPNAFNQQYASMDSRLAEKHRLRAHNQYLTMAVAFGLPGLVLFLVFLFLPARLARCWKRPEYLAFALVVLLSFLSEDTLETQAGATFFAFFQCLFLVGVDWSSKPSNAAPQP